MGRWRNYGRYRFIKIRKLIVCCFYKCHSRDSKFTVLNFWLWAVRWIAHRNKIIRKLLITDLNITLKVILLTKCSPGNQIEKNEMGGACGTLEEGRGAYRILVGRPKGRRPIGRPRHRWEDNIKRDLKEVRWGAWTGLSWLRTGTGGGLLSMR
jgi:hypothetical protein